MNRPVLSVAGLGVRYDDRPALSDVTFELAAGTLMAVIGPNGSGKSTLLHAIVGLVDPSEGTVECRRDRTALVLQSTDVDRSLPITVAETVRMARYANRGLLGRFDADDRAAVTRAMERLGIADLAHRQLHDLSGGQRQRVLVAQGLAQDADLVLFDEPVTGLDIVSRQTILDVMAEETRAGRAVVMTTHNLEEARRSDLVLLLATTAVACGPPDEVIQEDHLQSAFPGRMLRIEGAEVVVDDPHHLS